MNTNLYFKSKLLIRDSHREIKMGEPRKMICITRGYLLTEITRKNNSKQEVSYEITDPLGNLYKQPASLTEALHVLKDIIYNRQELPRD